MPQSLQEPLEAIKTIRKINLKKNLEMQRELDDKHSCRDVFRSVSELDI